MNRTKEFHSLFSYTKQKKQKIPKSNKILLSQKNLLENIKKKSIESKNNLKIYLNEIDNFCVNNFYDEILCKYFEIMRIEMMIEVNRICNKINCDKKLNKVDDKKSTNYKNKNKNKNIHIYNDQDQEDKYENNNFKIPYNSNQSLTYKQETQNLKKRFPTTTFQELGQILTEISLHTKIQNEHLITISESLKKAEKNSIFSKNKLKNYFLIMKKRRNLIFKFFIFWFIFILIVYIMKKYFLF